jgi:hypothetical protein
LSLTALLISIIKSLGLLNRATAGMQRRARLVAKSVEYSRLLRRQVIVKSHAQTLLGLGLRVQVNKPVVI